jgi:hypothetical protein
MIVVFYQVQIRTYVSWKPNEFLSAMWFEVGVNWILNDFAIFCLENLSFQQLSSWMGFGRTWQLLWLILGVNLAGFRNT